MNSSNWKKIIKPYATPNNSKSWWQLANSIIPFILLWALAIKTITISYWLAVPICLLLGLFTVRIFIICHDCGHGSFFKSAKLRNLTGYLTGILTIVPYWQWTKEHATHHSTSGNLSKRGHGDIWTLTVKEYQGMSLLSKIGYRLYRFPLVTFLIGPIYIFVLKFRFTQKWDGPKEKRSVYITNIALALIVGSLCYLIGWKDFLLIQGTILFFSGPIGVWLFYVQHQYEETYWRTNQNWDYFEASMQGSSYFKLPKILQWFSGNIGFHHIHHLSHQIPNYNLESCFNENKIFQNPKIITFWSSFPTIFLKLWDEENNKMITWGEYNKQQSECFSPTNAKLYKLKQKLAGT